MHRAALCLEITTHECCTLQACAELFLVQSDVEIYDFFGGERAAPPHLLKSHVIRNLILFSQRSEAL